MRALFQELAHQAVHERTGDVLWCDGDHGFNPYDFAELNLTRGHSAEEGATRVLVKRCMTPFQWDSVLTQHVAQKLAAVEASLVVVLPFDSLFSTDEIKDWEAEDFVRTSLRHLEANAQRHDVPVLLGVDMARWWLTHPTLARMTREAAHHRWSVDRPAGRLRVTAEAGTILDPDLRRGVTLMDYLSTEQEAETVREAERLRPIMPIALTAPLPPPKPIPWRRR